MKSTPGSALRIVKSSDMIFHDVSQDQFTRSAFCEMGLYRVHRVKSRPEKGFRQMKKAVKKRINVFSQPFFFNQEPYRECLGILVAVFLSRRSSRGVHGAKHLSLWTVAVRRRFLISDAYSVLHV